MRSVPHRPIRSVAIAMFALAGLLLACSFTNSLAASPAPGGHLPLSYGGDNQQPYPALTALADVAPGALPGAQLRVAVLPNPFRGSTTLQLSLLPGAPASVEIFDLGGRLVRRFNVKAGAQPATSVIWDGRYRLGARAQSGVYLARVTSSGQVRTARLVLLR